MNGTCVVVGGASGMGAASARRLAADGWQVAVADVDLEGAAEVAKAIGPSAKAIKVDVTDASSIAKMTDTVRDWAANDPTGLVYSAGTLARTKYLDITSAEWRQTMAVNLDGAFLCAQALLPGMQQASWGRLVFFSSTAGKSVSTLGGAHYTASKAGILGLTRAVAKEFAADGITSNAVCPGLIETPMVMRLMDSTEVEFHRDSFPIPRLGDPAEVAALVGYLMSEEASYVTGAALDINGGDLMI